MDQQVFTVSRFENRNGVISWRVDGRLNGLRIRRNFKTQEESAAEKATLDLKALQLESGMRSVPTFLTEEQVREAETVFNRLKDSPRSLSFCVDYTLNNYQEPQSQQKLASAVADYLAGKQHELEQDQISLPHLTRLRRDLNRLKKHFGIVTVAELTSERLIKFFNLGKPSLKTYNNRRGIVSTFLKYAFQQSWIVANPVLKIPHYRIRRKRGSAATLSATEAAALMKHVEGVEEGRYVPFFALCLFAGIRPCVRTGEITRIKPQDVNLETGIIFVTAYVSKVREIRKTVIHPNLAAWLKAYPLDKFPIVPENLQHVRAKIAKKFALSHDIMRHTFISMFVAKYRSVGEASLQAGNSESIIRKHYLDLKSETEAETFFGIMPRQPAELIQEMLPIAV